MKLEQAFRKQNVGKGIPFMKSEKTQHLWAEGETVGLDENRRGGGTVG